MSRRPLKYRIGGADVSEQNIEGGDGRGIRGPNSALTEFLRQQGISAEEIRRRHERRLAGEEDEEEVTGGADGGDNADNNVPVVDLQVSESVDALDQEELEMRIAARRKRRAAKGQPDDEYTDSEDEIVPIKRKLIGEETQCFDCECSFIITITSKLTSNGLDYYCPSCTTLHEENDKLIKKQLLLSRKKRQRLAIALLDRQDVKLPSLQDLSIKKITEKIELVEEFGDIGSINLNKICKILCRNRSLNDITLKLFLNPELKSIEFWDCSKLSKKSYDTIVSYCPNLEKLTLLMCGRFHNDNLNYVGSNLLNLTSIELDGPFLISNDQWQVFFKQIGKRLKSFKISNTHRFSNDTFKEFLEKCGENLEVLKLSRLDGINDKESYDLIPIFLTKLKQLEISYPHHEDLISDSLLINILSINGEFLSLLNLDGCSGLTDEFLINGIKPFCFVLRNLSLQKLDQITNEGFVGLFNNWKLNLGLNEIYLTKCFSLGDEGIIEILLHSGNSLVELSLNSIKDLTVQSFQLLKSPNLTYLDIGFVRCVDDTILELIGKNCANLKVIDCYGNNRCTSNAIIRDGLKVIGRQSDVI